MRRVSTTVFVLLLLLTPLGCASDDGLLLDVETDAQDPAFSDIYARLGVTVRAGPNGYGGFTQGVTGGATFTCSTSQCEPWDLGRAVYNACVPSVLGTPSADASTPALGGPTGANRATGTTTSCATRIQQIEDNVCAANTLLTLVQTVSPLDVRIAWDTSGAATSTGIVTIPPQDAYSNSVVGILAQNYASEALRLASDAFDNSAGHSQDCTDAALQLAAGTGSLASITQGQELANFYRETLSVLADAAEIAANSGAAVSDAMYSERSDQADAAQALLSAVASRSSSAHALIITERAG